MGYVFGLVQKLGKKSQQIPIKVENNYLSAQEDKERKDAQALLEQIEKGSIVVSEERKQELENQVAVMNALDQYKDQLLKDACQNLKFARVWSSVSRFRCSLSNLF